jgi:transcriptional regulator with XRE-family HTH domain
VARQGKQLTDDVRAAVISALLVGQGVAEVAQQFKLSKSTVSELKKGIAPEHFEQLRTKKEEDFGALLAGYLRETITTLSAQARFFRNEKWLQKQSASELAVLHGVCADKAIRLLEAIERANEIGEEAAES